jgi:hypothetical protein
MLHGMPALHVAHLAACAQVWTAVTALAIASTLAGALRSEAKAAASAGGQDDEELIITSSIFTERPLNVTSSTSLDVERPDESLAALMPFQARALHLCTAVFRGLIAAITSPGCCVLLWTHESGSILLPCCVLAALVAMQLTPGVDIVGAAPQARREPAESVHRAGDACCQDGRVRALKQGAPDRCASAHNWLRGAHLNAAATRIACHLEPRNLTVVLVRLLSRVVCRLHTRLPMDCCACCQHAFVI